MKTLYIIGAVVGAVAVGAAAYGGYRMLRASVIAEQSRRMTGPTQNTEQPISRQRPNVTGLSLVNRDLTVPVIRGRLSVHQDLTHEGQSREQAQSQTSADTSDSEPSRNPNVRVNLFTLR